MVFVLIVNIRRHDSPVSLMLHIEKSVWFVVGMQKINIT
jgi:hypothetical protein